MKNQWKTSLLKIKIKNQFKKIHGSALHQFYRQHQRAFTAKHLEFETTVSRVAESTINKLHDNINSQSELFHTDKQTTTTMASHLIKSFKKECGQVTANDRLFQKVLLKGNSIRINTLNENTKLSDKEKEALSTLPFAHSIELQALKELNLTTESIKNPELLQKINEKKGEIMEQIYEDGYAEVFDAIRTSIPLPKTETLSDLNSQLMTITDRLAQNNWTIIDVKTNLSNGYLDSKLFVWNEDLPGLMEIQITSEAMVNAKKAKISLAQGECEQIIDTFRSLNQDVRIQETASITFKGNQFLTHLKESVKSNSTGNPTQIGVHDAYEFHRTLDMIQKNKMQPLTDKQNESIDSIMSMLKDKMETQFQQAWSPPDRADAKTISKSIKANIEKRKPLLLSENGFSNNETKESIKSKLLPTVIEFDNLNESNLNTLYERIAQAVTQPETHSFIPIHDLDLPIELTEALKQTDLFNSVTRQNAMMHLNSIMKPNSVATLASSAVSSESLTGVKPTDLPPPEPIEPTDHTDFNKQQAQTVPIVDTASPLHDIDIHTEPIAPDIVENHQENQNKDQLSSTTGTPATSRKENAKPDGLNRKRPSWQVKAQGEIDKATAKNKKATEDNIEESTNKNPRTPRQ